MCAAKRATRFAHEHAMSASDPIDGVSPPEPAEAPDEIHIPRATPVDPRFDTSRIGQLIDGRYRILEVVGRGGMGTVYKAEHEAIRRVVALKLLHAPLAQVPEVSRRFEREAFAIGRIEHPNCVNVSDFGRLPDGSLYLVMEYLEGTALSDELATHGRLPIVRSLRILRHVVRGLGHAHSHEIVHRDVKPENVIVLEHDGDPNFAKILDFGIAKLIGSAARDDGGGTLTQAGMAFGTPLYMSPEQALGQPIDGRADLYAASVMGFEMIVGKPPFRSEDKIDVMSMHATKPVPTMSEVDPTVAVPPAVEQLLRTGLAKRASERFADADAYVAAIDAVLAELAPPRPSTASPTLAQDISARRPPSAAPLSPAAQTGVTALAGDPNLAPTAAGPGYDTLALPEASPAPRLSRSKQLVLAGSAALLLIAIAALVLSQPDRPSPERPLETAAMAADAGEPGDERPLVEQASELLGKGAPQEAIDLLSAHSEELMEQADAQLLLGHAHAALRNDGDALSAYSRAIAADKALGDDPAFRANIEPMLVDGKDPTTPVDAAALLYRLGVEDTGERIVDWASSGKWLKRRQHAVAVAEELGLGDRIDRVGSLLIDLRQLDSCEDRRAVVGQLRAISDPSALDGLRRLPAKIRRGSCLRADISKAIKYFETLAAEADAGAEGP